MAATKMKVLIIAKETIKPSSPTPNHLRTFNFSLLDQLAPSFYSHIVFFYSTNPITTTRLEISQSLKKSLSEVLTCFHPLAGRIKDRFSIDCNDEGADYVEAQINCKISDVLQQPNMKTLNHFVPTAPSVSNTSSPLLLVQVTFFDSGGMALGIATSHKIVDGITISAFLKSWTAFALRSCSDKTTSVLPDFTTAASLLPPSNQLPTKSPFSGEARPNGIMRRYVFNSSKIADLKARSASSTVPRPSRVEVVSALICKCAMDVSKSRPGGGSFKKLLLYRAVNLRPQFDPPLSKYSFGNMIGPSTVMIDYERREPKEAIDDLPDIVSHLRKGILEFGDGFVKKLKGDEYLEAYFNKYAEVEEMKVGEDVDFYILTSLCNMPFYETEFGWGKPTWASLVWESSNPNRIRLMDTRDGGGVEAWVTFKEEDIALFEGHPEWSEFASLNPSVDLKY